MQHMQYMFKDKCLADIWFDPFTKEVNVQRNIVMPMHTPFLWGDPSFQQLEEFVASRCLPATRYNIKECLQSLGLQSYNVLDIISKTHGVLVHSWCWFRFDTDPAGYIAVEEVNPW